METTNFDFAIEKVIQRLEKFGRWDQSREGLESRQLCFGGLWWVELGNHNYSPKRTENKKIHKRNTCELLGEMFYSEQQHETVASVKAALSSLINSTYEMQKHCNVNLSWRNIFKENYNGPDALGWISVIAQEKSSINTSSSLEQTFDVLGHGLGCKLSNIAVGKHSKRFGCEFMVVGLSK